MLDRVTFTGIDNRTKIQDLLNLYKKYPFIEFGVLVSENNTNHKVDNKYPDLVVLRALKKRKVPLSLHVCGRIAREIMQHNNWKPLYDLMGSYMHLFERIQLNISMLNTFSTEVEFPRTHTFIIQTKSNNLDIYNTYKDVENIVGFQDNSGGTGRTETSWMITDDAYFGYAGGLGVDNIKDVVIHLSELRHDKPFWVDMETKIRNDKNWFDIKKCEAVCKILTENQLIQ